MARRFTYPSALAFAAALIVAACAANESSGSKDLPGNDAELAAFLREQVATYQQHLAGLSMDTGVKVSIASYDTVVELTFKYLQADAGQAAAIARFTNPLLVKQACANAKRKYWMERGVVFRFIFRDRDNNLALRSDVDSAVCQALGTTTSTLPS